MNREALLAAIRAARTNRALSPYEFEGAFVCKPWCPCQVEFGDEGQPFAGAPRHDDGLDDLAAEFAALAEASDV